MSDPFIGEIRMFAGTFAPRGWALCDGQLLAISQYEALFTLLGTTYGGDGRTTFGLPELRGRLQIHKGTGPGLSPRNLGERGGAEDATVSSVAQLPPHSHTHFGAGEPAGRSDPSAAVRASYVGPTDGIPAFGDLEPPPENPLVAMANDTIASAGGWQAHANVQPFLCVNFIIALLGVYPSRD
jgi:microcystin-dependent protein